ncbi:MAG TPA: hypothetical protein PKU74_01775 [Candidatus Omnitrophota bacterium]|nr:hypothetical protein [Candidatus Omnitrophota bacterium]
MKSRIPLFLLCWLLPVFYLTVTGGWFLTKKAYIATKIFAQSGLSYDRLRRQQPSVQAALKARDILPPGTDVSAPFTCKGFSYVIWRYFLFPHRVVDTSDFHLDGRNRFPGEPAEWVEVPLTDTASLYARPHVAGALAPGVSPLFPSPSLPVVLTAVLLFSGYNILTGVFMLRAMGFALKDWGRLWYYATSYLLGFSLPTAVIWILVMLGVPFSRGVVLGTWVLLGILLGGLSRRCPVFLREEENRPASSQPCRTTRFAAPVLGGLVTAAAAGILIVTVSTGVLDWDGMSHWILKSKTIYYYQHFNFEYTHLNSYPLLWPLNIACQFAFLGGMYDELAKWTSALCFLVFIIQLLKSLQLLGLKPAWRYGILLFFLVSAFHDFTKPWWYVHFTFANAENLFLAFWGGALTLVLAWLKARDQRRYLWLALILMTGLNLSKLEGMFATGILAATVVLLFRKSLLSERAGAWIWAAFLSVGLPLGWMHWVSCRGGDFSALTHFQEGISTGKVLLLLKINLRNFCSNNMPVYSLLAGFYIFVFRKRLPWLESEVFLGLVSAGMVIFAGVAHLGTPLQSLSDIPPEVFPRLFLHATPPLLLLFSSRIARQASGRKFC